MLTYDNTLIEAGPTGLPRCAPRDIVIGYPLGSVPPPAPPSRVDPDPVRALRDALLPALRHPPCVIAFSGGRDSSLLLAVATDVAAQEGLAPPVALTLRYPGDAAAEESGWQETVIAWLRDRGHDPQWLRVDIADDLDLIGPLTAPVLRAHDGPTYPAAIGNTVLLARHAAGGSLVTGNAGDEVLGGHRAPVLRAVLRRRGRGLARADWQLAALCASPRRARELIARRSLGDIPWLRPQARAAVRTALAREAADRPLRWDRSVSSVLATRAAAIGDRTRETVAAQLGCRLVEPFRDAAFVASYAAFGGLWGGLNRTPGTRLLAAGLLPDAVTARQTKAAFNGSRFGRVSRAFARAWDGTGVDTDLVDPVALRDAWLSDEAPGLTALLLQQAWLASVEKS